MESLTTSLIAWKQFESGLHEFKEALGKDKGALKGLTGALDSGNDVANDLASDVKEVAKRLSEKIDNNIVQQVSDGDNAVWKVWCGESVMKVTGSDRLHRL